MISILSISPSWSDLANVVGGLLLFLVAALVGGRLGREWFGRRDEGGYGKLRTVLMCGFFVLALYRVFGR